MKAEIVLRVALPDTSDGCRLAQFFLTVREFLMSDVQDPAVQKPQQRALDRILASANPSSRIGGF